MNRHTLLLALCLVPALAPAQSQEGMGLDLTEETQPKSSDESPTPPPAEDATPAVASKSVEEEAPPPEALPPLTDITQEDRVKSFQRKVYRKKGRFELTPAITVSVNDPFYSKVGASLRGAYYLADTLAISARGSWMQVVPSDDVRTAKRTFNSKIYNSVPNWSAMGDVEWSPLYGKVAFLNSILHFDGYLLAGAGVVNTETSSLPGRGLNPAADLGLGMRFVAKDFVAVNVALINTSYVDQPLGSAKGAVQNVMTLNAGISLFLPFRSTGRDAE
ncbi:outer membrane beta-barrel domain-containing protein [Myxococcus sp. K15C18031901]|uniref:outer membrane beta-barrel domain-containing protein n=1 Tax=Myxococcus dinghuensis TaxID=2906761 RepID=UPI0020A7CD36|nr:outer membrane beta-barrel domain-containing protein [Myxococcus dinghuensis]MCP3097709.1 outer membrane beta-barrel domain-containing protein [Myxococcus dinghuensis]